MIIFHSLCIKSVSMKLFHKGQHFAKCKKLPTKIRTYTYVYAVYLHSIYMFNKHMHEYIAATYECVLHIYLKLKYCV